MLNVCHMLKTDNHILARMRSKLQKTAPRSDVIARSHAKMVICSIVPQAEGILEGVHKAF